nr:MAG TPA: hypothetical protein [Caudoviricetes sp.]
MELLKLSKVLIHVNELITGYHKERINLKIMLFILDYLLYLA